MFDILKNRVYWKSRIIELIMWTIALLSLQFLMSLIMAELFAPQTIRFISGNPDNFRAGDPMNIIGWGNYSNYNNESAHTRLFNVTLMYLAFRMFPPIFHFVPTWLFAGAFSNLLELLLLGRVLDFIIFPGSGDKILAISLGDIAIFAGLVTMVIRGAVNRKANLPELHRQLIEWGFPTDTVLARR